MNSKKNQIVSFIIITAILFVTIGITYNEGIRWLIGVWLEDKEYSHGFLVPLVSAYFVYLKKKELAALPIRPEPAPGTILLILSFILFVTSKISSIVQLEIVAFFVLLPALILLLLSRNHLILLIFPLSYLLFALPIMDYLPGDIYPPFQLLTAAASAKLLNIIGYPVFQDGMVLQLKDYTLFVARECSGVRFLYSIIAVGIPLVYLSQRSLRKAAVIIGISVGIAILVNIFRVTLAGVLAYNFGINMLHGPSHILQGYSVAVIGFLTLFILNSITIKYFPSKSPLLCDQAILSIQNVQGYSFNSTKYLLTIIGIIFMLVACIVIGRSLGNLKPVGPNQPLSSLPKTIGHWKAYGSGKNFGNKFYPKAKEELVRTYKNEQGQELTLYIGYFPLQNNTNRMISYHAQALHDQTKATIRFNQQCNGPSFINWGIIKDQRQQDMEVIFWYWFPFGNETGMLKAKIAPFRSIIQNQQNNSAVILITMPVKSSEFLPQTISPALENFSTSLPCVLKKIIP